jgi:hypothetical protein
MMLRTAGCVLAIAVLATNAEAANSNQSINIQGVLRDATGALQSMAVGLVVNFYPSQTGAGPFYNQNFPTVPVDNGFFSIELSDPKLSFSANPDTWVGVQVAGDPTELPRQHLNAAPYALVCTNATGDITPNSITVAGNGTLGGNLAVAGNVDITGSLGANIPHAHVYSETAQAMTSRNAWVTASGFSVTAPRDGTYLIQSTARVFCLATNDQWWKAALYNVTTSTRIAQTLGMGYVPGYGACEGDTSVPITAVVALKANDVIALQFYIAGTGTAAVNLIGDVNGGSSITLLRIGN